MQNVSKIICKVIKIPVAHFVKEKRKKERKQNYCTNDWKKKYCYKFSIIFWQFFEL